MGSGDLNPNQMFEKIPEHVKSMIPNEILKAFESKSAEWHEACAMADEEYARIGGMVKDFARVIDSPEHDRHYKAAGLASVYEFYPSVAQILTPVISEIPAHLIKQAAQELSVTDVSVKHPYVVQAKRIEEQMNKTAELTALASRTGQERKALRGYYDEYHSMRKSALFPLMGNTLNLAAQQPEVSEPFEKKANAASLFLSNMMSRGLANGLSNMATQAAHQTGLDEDDEAVKGKVFNSLDNRLHESNLRDIETQSLINDLSVNDDVLNKFPREDIVATFNDLYRTAPLMMRNPVQARLFLRQYMTQGSMAPNEILPALQMNRMNDNRKRLSEEA
jgi:hypothetical protein